MAALTNGDVATSVRSGSSTLVKEAVGASISGVLAFLGFWRISGVSWSDLGGLWGRSDAIVEYSMAKTQSKSILGFFDPNLGYPHGQDWTHFPVLDPANRIELKLLTSFLDPVTAVNVLFVASFPVIAILMYAALRNLHVMRSLAVVGGVSLALVGYHFDYEHPFLGNYWAIPVGLLWLSILSNSETVLSSHCSKKTVLLVGVAAALVVGVHNPQYAMFFSLIGAVAVIFARRRVPGSLNLVPRGFLLLLPGLALLGFLALGRLLRTIPAVTSSTQRPLEDSYIWAGQFISLVTTSGDSILSGLPFNRDLLAALDTTAWTGVPAVQSAVVAGATVVVIALTLSLVAMTRKSTSHWVRITDPVRLWSAMWLTGTSFFITGGMGVAFAALIYPQVRVWSRISIVLAALALTGCLIFASGLIGLWTSPRSRMSTALTISVATLIAIVFLDQFTGRYPIQSDTATLSELKELGAAGSVALPDNCPILNLPVMSFPEAVPPGRMQAYDHLLPYLAGTPWQLSYGAIRGQLGSRWTDHLAVQPGPLAQQAAAEGFCGVLIDTYGLDENSPSLEQYEQAIGPFASSALDRWFLFSLPQSGAVEPQRSLLSRPEVNYGSGFADEEVWDGGVARRPLKNHVSSLRVWNPSYQDTQWIARTALTSDQCPSGHAVRISTSSGWNEALSLVPGQEREVYLPLRIPARSYVDVVIEDSSDSCPPLLPKDQVGIHIRDVQFDAAGEEGISLFPISGFHDLERADNGESWRWTDGPLGKLIIANTNSSLASMEFNAQMQAAPCALPQQVTVMFDGEVVSSAYVEPGQSVPLNFVSNVPPMSASRLELSSTDSGCSVEGDSRLLGVSLRNTELNARTGSPPVSY